MITVHGVYEGGQIKLLEEVPLKTKKRVLITFLDDDDTEDDIREASLNNSTEWFKNYLEDSGEDLYQDYAKKKS
ncbi:MAG TPA: antitoxin AF2212-like protein [Parafilimonas sp.]|nr:antitoxin AF2212-like protein [Parafilimonas sp.]